MILSQWQVLAAIPGVAYTAPAKIKITDVQVTVTNPTKGAGGNFVRVKIITDQPDCMGSAHLFKRKRAHL